MRKYPFNMRNLVTGLVNASTANEEKLTDTGRFSPISHWPVIFKTSKIMSPQFNQPEKDFLGAQFIMLPGGYYPYGVCLSP